MSPEQRKWKAEDAKALLDNPILKEAFGAVAGYLESAALACPPDDKEKAARIINGKQILAGIKREIVRIVDDGQVAEIQLREIDRKKSMMQRVGLVR